MQEVNTQIYYVRNIKTGEAVLSNSSFKVKDLGGLATDIKNHADCVEINDCSQCYHANEDELCDLNLITRRIIRDLEGDNVSKEILMKY